MGNNIKKYMEARIILGIICPGKWPRSIQNLSINNKALTETIHIMPIMVAA